MFSMPVSTTQIYILINKWSVDRTRNNTAYFSWKFHFLDPTSPLRIVTLHFRSAPCEIQSTDYIGFEGSPILGAGEAAPFHGPYQCCYDAASGKPLTRNHPCVSEITFY